MSSTPRDAIVAGGALAGSLAALALARLGLRVTLIEANARPRGAARDGGGDGRSISLSLASVRVLESLGLWSALAAAATPITMVHVSEAGRFGQMRLTAREMEVAALGQVVPAEALLAGIEEAALAAGVECESPAEAEAAPLVGGLREVEIASAGAHKKFATRLLLIADGAGSKLRAALGIGARERRYEALAWVTTARAAHPQPGVAWERFTREGTLAILPRAGKNVGIVWALPETRTDEFAALAPQAFLDRVAAAIGGRLGALSPAATVRRFPLVATQAHAQTAERAVVIGNAAHALHPVAAQGFNLTVRDIAMLAECVAESLDDPGAASVLERYARARRRDQARTRAFTGAARGLGDWRAPLASPARATGLLAFELLRPLARECARQGMGLSPRPLPALVRGARL